MQRQPKDYFLISLKGIAMGAADVVPGVSGGTIAFISGIYEELIESIDNLSFSFFKTWKQNGFKSAWTGINGTFLLALFSGVVISILSLAKLIKYLLHNEPVLLWSFFFGLVLASILFIGKQIKSWTPRIIIATLVTTMLSYCLTLAEPFASPESPYYLIFCGFIAIIAMILPGVSGAFILLILGAYETAIDILNNLIKGVTTLDLDVFKGAIFKFMLLAVGAIFGIKVFSKALNWMFKNHKNLTLAILTGFMIGSLNKIWPWKVVTKTKIDSDGLEVTALDRSILPSSYNGDNQLLLALICIAIGFTVVLLLEYLGKKKIAV